MPDIWYSMTRAGAVASTAIRPAGDLGVVVETGEIRVWDGAHTWAQLTAGVGSPEGAFGTDAFGEDPFGGVGGGTTSVIQIFFGGASGASIQAGIGTPEGSVSAAAGSLYLRQNGGAGSTLYVKESGSGATGWVAK